MNIRRHLIIYIILLILPSALYAQKKAIDDARTNIRKGTNLEQAEKSMRTLLQDSANMQNEKIWLTLFDAVKKQYEQLNEKLYLKQQSDTAKLFTHTKHMFSVLESLDSIDAKPGKDGNVAPQYRKKHASYLMKYRSNLYNGGVYYVMKQKYADAVPYFEAYIDCARQPLFSSYDLYNKDEQKIVAAAYWTTFCGYKLQNTNIISEYSKLALRDPSREVYLLQYVAEAYNLKNDTANYRQTLEEGFNKFPSNAYFFPHLVLYYAQRGWHQKVLAISAVALSIDGDNEEALLARSSALLETEQYDECIKISERLIAKNDSVARVFLNIGLAYYNQSLPLLKKTVLTKAEREKLADLCSKAQPYLERYRVLKPDDSETWAPPLYNIYLTLNNGDGFEEMEQILSK